MRLLALSAVAAVTFAGFIDGALAQSQFRTNTAVDRASIPVPQNYIVVFKDTVSNSQNEVAGLNLGATVRVKFIYNTTVKGFAAEIPAAAYRALQNNPRIAYIEQDQTVSVTATTTQSNPPSWGLDRVDQTTNIFSQSYSYSNSGLGVTAYVIDTGILSTHDEFKAATGSRVAPGYSVISGGTSDCNGHGTHVAGTLGGNTMGVAKAVTLVPVRVLDCNGSGSISGVIAGVDWVAATAISQGTNFKAVANMSLGGSGSAALDTAVKNAIAKGVTIVVSAGNSNRDARNFSPARVQDAVTVGATASSDTRASYSNFGSLVEIFAPGSSITSAWSSGTSSMRTISGTSMAAPHVAGSIALLLEEMNLGVVSTTPSMVRTQLISDAQKNLTLNTRGNPNNFLNTNYLKLRPGS